MKSIVLVFYAIGLFLIACLAPQASAAPLVRSTVSVGPAGGVYCQGGSIISPGNTNCCMVGEICLPVCVEDVPCEIWLNQCQSPICPMATPIAVPESLVLP
jgi:hypothetical protein